MQRNLACTDVGMPFIPEILVLLLPLGFAYLIASVALLAVCTRSCVRRGSRASPSGRTDSFMG
ncbi:MAG TPA: hypothetical protein VFV71_04690 [Burkholderiales bacterium]|nr:hypothetical protein [Burkholderiales bacterium]